MATEQLTSDWAPENFFETTLSADITDSDTDILLSSVPTQSEGTLVINPDSSSSREIIYYNSKTSTKVTCPSAALGRGYDNTTATSHTSGTKVIMAPIADWFNSLKTLFDTTEQGWTTLSGTHSVGTGYNSGNRSFEISTSTDHSSILSEGMRYKVTRDTTPPTQCADLEASSSHYASKSSPTGLPSSTTVSVEAWVKLESYTGSSQYIIADNSADNGFGFYVGSDGTVTIFGGSSSVYDIGTTYQSIPLNRWVHLAATLTINSAAVVYIDGVSVPVNYTNSAATTLGTPGTIYLGRQATASAGYFDGKLADVRVWSDIRTATEIQDNMYAYPSDTTGLVAHFKLNGDFTDASSNGNDLTAQNSAVATNTDNPWNATEYGIITNVTSSTIQVFCPEGYGIPNETLSAPFYSTQSAPFGFPRDRGKWEIQVIGKTTVPVNSPSTSTWYETNFNINIPIGAWRASYSTSFYVTQEGTGGIDGALTLSTSASSEVDTSWKSKVQQNGSVTPGRLRTMFYRDGYVTEEEQTTWYLIMGLVASGTAQVAVEGTDRGDTLVKAECAYL